MTDQLKSELEDDAKGESQENVQAPASEGAERSEHANMATSPAPKASRLRKRIVRTSLVLLVLALATAAYVERDSLAKIFSARANGESASSESSSRAKAELKVLYWQDPMNPTHRSDKPGKAPDGMDLVPVYENGPGASNLPEGAFMISPEKQQLIGVTYGLVAYKPMSKTLRAVARLAYDETKIVRIHTKIEGWIENVYVDFTGKEVKRGEPLISLYSPDLMQTQQEYLLALKGRSELSESPFKEAVAGSDSLLESARKRLELWDISDAQIKDIEKRGTPTKTLTLYAPSNGFVLARNAYPKQRVTPEAELYSIADLSAIWAIADIYEYEAPEIQVGQSATMTLSYYPGRRFQGKVTYIYPQLDSSTRTLKVRVEFANENFALKPDMYANVELKIDYGKKLTVPQEAVLDSGSEQLVFVALEGGYFEPRKVQLGAKVDNNFIVLAGLKAGERIATSANFLIDSESKLKSAASGMGMPGMPGMSGGGASDKKPQPDHSGHQQGAQTASQSKPEDQMPAEGHSQHQAKPQRKILYWYDSMNPTYKSDKPGKAPDGMDLVPKYADEKKPN